MSLYLNLIFLAVLAPSVACATWSVRNSVELSPQHRVLEQKGFSRLSEVNDLFGMGSLHAEWSGSSWFAEAKPEVRFVFSPGVLDAAPASVSVQTSKRVFNSRRTLWRNEGGEGYADFDRLNVRYSFENADVYAGRRPLSMGVLRFFPVWNKLTLPLVFQPGPEWIENPDVVGGSLQSGRYSHRLFASRTGEPRTDDLVLLESRFSGEGLDLQTLVGTWWQHPAVGLAGAFDVAESTLRFEALYTARFRQEQAQGQAGLGFERALNEKWTLVAEALWQSAGVSDVRNVLTPPNRFMVLSGRFYVLPNISYQLHSLWQLRAGLLAAIGPYPTYVALAGFEHSVSDNTTLTLKVKQPFGSERGEFGSQRVSDILGRKIGASSTALLQLQSTF